MNYITRSGGLMNEGLIQAQAMATRAACARLTTQHLKALHDSVERASCLHSRSQWDRKAVAHTEIFNLLADVTDDPSLTLVLRGMAGFVHQLALVVGPVANGMIVSSRQRLLAHIRAGDADGAALEMEKHLRSLHYMWRLVCCTAKTRS
jgi:GntR family transcriptional regulator, transcriptional repressor for pyruvate dehydrogenase complex